ncbi:hypothetical protein A3K72_02170 [Candidatus Woesearchaeota archaeon RBG_13_36_6]|nr:MAG: hypothetical protein A3K72_02170 [Candidatus Woesearchaeota archaeon RBG_13_36_6]
MIPIKDLLNKIKWDKNLNPNEYSIGYFDRISKKLVWIDFGQIKNIDGNFMILEKENKEVDVPLHRIREVKQKKETIWKR